MFGSSVDHIRGTFDSEEESRVAKILVEMRRERYLNGILPHPVVGGVTADFMIQLGPEAGSLNEGQMVVIEYDGLGIDRPKGLQQKRQRYRRLSRHGLPSRWLTEPTREAVKEVILDYSPPRFVVRQDVCECGNVEKHIVITTGDKLGEFKRDVTCNDCESTKGESPTPNEQTHDEAPPD